MQWDKMLTMIGRTLEENGIPNVFVKGNVYMRNRAVTSFKVCSHHRLSLNSRFVHVTSCHIIQGLFSSLAVTEFEVCSRDQLSHHSRSVLITGCHWIRGLFTSPAVTSFKVCSHHQCWSRCVVQCYRRVPRALHNTTIN